jgi:hypothetical protein
MLWLGPLKASERCVTWYHRSSLRPMPEFVALRAFESHSF